LNLVDFFRIYKNKLDTRIHDVESAIVGGSVSDMEQYKAMVGEIQGLSYALEQVRTLLEKVDDDINSA